MKVDFHRVIEFVPDWKDNAELPEKEQIMIILSPLEYGDFLHVVDRISKIGAGGDLSEIQEDERRSKMVIDLMTDAGDIIPRYVQEVRNLEGPDGPIQPEDITKYSYFFELGIEVLNTLVEVSTPNEDEEGNLDTQPGSLTSPKPPGKSKDSAQDTSVAGTT